MKEESQNLINPYIIDCNNINEETHSWPVGILYNRRIVMLYELELITGGSGKIFTDGKWLEAVKGDIFFRKPGMDVQGISGYYFCTIIFDPVYSKSHKDIYNSKVPYWLAGENERLPNVDFFDNIPYKFNTPNFNEYLQLFLNIFNTCSQNNINNQLSMKTDLLKIFTMLNKELNTQSIAFKSQSVKNNYKKIMLCKNYIDNNLYGSFSLDTLADMCGLSRTFFCRIFGEIIGQPPFEYIINQKLSIAKMLLSTTNMSIKEISSSCGFSDVTYFYRLFRRHFNMTPKSYRENLQLFDSVN